MKHARLSTLYKKLLRRYGPQHWWPGESPWEVMVGAILTQNTNWGNVEKAIANLRKKKLLSAKGLSNSPLAKIETAVRPSGYFRQKAKRVKILARHMMENWNGDLGKFFARETAAVREELLSLHGVGKETADSMLLYGGGHLIFPVDVYTVRFLERFGFGKFEKNRDYEKLRKMFEEGLPRDVKVYNEMHALIVRWGKETKSSSQSL